MNHRDSSNPNNKGPLGVLVGSVVLAGVLTLLAAWASGKEFWMPVQASDVAEQVDWVFNVITWISIFFFLLVVILMVLFMVQYRRRDPREKASSDVTHNTPLELTWTIIPLILVIGIFYAGMVGYINLRRPPLGAYEVQVKAQRWSWTFSHRNGCVDTNRLVIPVGRPVRLVMESADVLHAAFIPEFRVKQDIVPGRITDLWFTVKEAGTYQFWCAEYCGKDHSQMHAAVEAMDEDDFQAYLEDCASVIDDAAEEHLPILARQRIYPRCASCHALTDRAGTGPGWRGLWERTQNGETVFADGASLKDLIGPGKQFATPEDYLRDSILNPKNKIVMNFPGSMPTFQGALKPRELTAIIEFIKRLNEFDEQGQPLPGTPAAQAAESMKAGGGS